MKRIITSILLCSVIVCSSASCKSTPSNDEVSQEQSLRALVDEYRGTEDFRVVNLGHFATTMLKNAAGLAGEISDEPQVQTALSSIRDIKGINVVHYGDCAEEVVSSINSRLSGILKNDNLVLEAKDGGDVVRIFGFEDGEKEGSVKDIVISVPSEGVLVCVKGSLDLAKAMELANQAE